MDNFIDLKLISINLESAHIALDMMNYFQQES